MPRSRIFLPDINPWVALACRRHIHSVVSSQWLSQVSSESVVFCRVTQMGLLRLLTNTRVMGADVLSSRDAWRVYETMLSDERIAFAPEAFALEEQWRKLSSHTQPTPGVWTDAYLAAFVRTASMRLVTLDRAAAKLQPEALLLA